MTYDHLKSKFFELGYVFYKEPYKLNFVWERKDYVATNKFTDELHVAYINANGIGQVLTIPCTTKPGLKGSLLEPITVNGVRGTAVIECGQCIDTWEFRDTFNEFSKYPYFRQVKPINYYRDGNKDRIIDKVQRQLAKIFGTHWHAMSKPDTYGSGEVNNWSLGCMGSPEPEYKKILPLVRVHVSKYGKLFTGTIIDSINLK